MKTELFIALRYLRSRKNRFISFVSAMAFIGVFIGVFTMVVSLSVMTGFEENLKEKILGFTAHIVVYKLGGSFTEYEDAVKKIESLKGVVAASPFIMGQGLLSGATKGVSGVVIYGILPEKSSKVLSIRPAIMQGRGDISEIGKGNPPGIAIGKELAKIVSAFIGDEVTLISPQGMETPFGLLPKFKKFRVVAQFNSGMYEYDSSFVFAHLKDVQKFFNMKDEVSGIDVRIENPEDAETISQNIHLLLPFPQYYSKTWMEMNRNLFSALRLEKIVFFIILSLIVLVASFNIITTITMTVMEKRKEIAILRAMGASKEKIQKIFFLQGFIIGIVGESIGLIAGLILCYLLAKYEIIHIPGDIYYISTIPVKVKPLEVLAIAISSFILIILASIYPARKAGNQVPSEILRYV